MKTRHALYAGLAMATFVGLSVAWASDAKQEISVLRGAAQVKQADGSWGSSSSIPVGTWVRSSKAETTVRLPGVTMRMEPGATVRLSSLNGQASKVEAKGGRVFVKVDADSTCQLSTVTKQVQAGESEFVLDAGPEERLYVLNGKASVVNEKPTLQPLNSWSKAKTVALDGPDVRQRNKNRKRFVQGEENKGKRIGEDESPTASPSPTASSSPVFSPSPTFTPPSPSPTATTPPPDNPPPDTGGGGGGDALPIVGGILGAAGLGFFIANLDDDEDNNFNQAVRPASF